MKKYTISFGLMLIALNAGAVSFDCSKASTSVEKTICSDPLLGKLDDALAQNYKYMMARDIGGDGAKKDLRDTQKAWIATRNKCSTKACLVDTYKQRVDEICIYPGVHPMCSSSEDVAGESNAPQPAAVLNTPKFDYYLMNGPKGSCLNLTNYGYSVSVEGINEMKAQGGCVMDESSSNKNMGIAAFKCEKWNNAFYYIFVNQDSCLKMAEEVKKVTESKSQEPAAQPPQAVKSSSVMQLYGYTIQNGCPKAIGPSVNFGSFSNLVLDNCSQINGGSTLRVKVPFGKIFSRKNPEHVNALYQAYATDVQQPLQKIVGGGHCEVTEMPTGAKCLIRFADVIAYAHAYDGMDYFTVSYTPAQNQSAQSPQASASQKAQVTGSSPNVAKKNNSYATEQVIRVMGISEPTLKSVGEVTSKLINHGNKYHQLTDDYCGIYLNHPQKKGLEARLPELEIGSVERISGGGYCARVRCKGSKECINSYIRDQTCYDLHGEDPQGTGNKLLAGIAYLAEQCATISR
jgi:uncharacterized protein